MYVQSTIKGVKTIFKIRSNATRIMGGPYIRWYGVFNIKFEQIYQVTFSIFITTLKPFYI